MSKKVIYSKFFTPPKFLEMPSVSLEILPKGISFLSSKSTKQGLVPDIYGFVPLSPDIFVRGEIVKREPVIKALIDIRKKTTLQFVRFSVPEEKTYIFKTHLPDLNAEEIHDVLGFKIEENVPLSAKEAVFDYEVLDAPSKEAGLDVVVSVSPIKIIEDLQGIFSDAGLTPIFFSPESNNVARSVIKNNNEQVVVIVHIRESSIILSHVVYGVVSQTSSLNFGSSTFTDLLAKYFKVSQEEAKKIKKEKLYNENPDSMEIFSYLINTISAIKDEIYKFISYVDQRDSENGQVDKLILCGRDSMIVGFAKYLSSNLNISVDIADIWVNNFKLNNYVPEITKLDSMDMAVINGLSLF